MRQYWRLYKDGRRSNMVNMYNKSGIIGNKNNNSYSDAVKDDVNNNNTN